MDSQLTNISSKFEEKFFCKVCDLNFINQSALIQHASIVHVPRSVKDVIDMTEEKKKKSEEDGVDESSPADESAVVSDEVADVSEVYLCSECGEIFVTSDKMEEHCRLAHPSTAVEKCVYECSACGKRYDTEEVFDQHECGDEQSVTAINDQDQVNLASSNTEFPPNPDLTCAACSTVFVSRYALKRHLDIVHKAPPSSGQKSSAPRRTADGMHQCGRCKAVFKDMNTLKMHAVDVHKMKWNNVRERTPQNCHICNKRFSSTGNLNKHIKTVHRQWPVKMDIQSHVKRAQKQREVNIIFECLDPEEKLDLKNFSNSSVHVLNQCQELNTVEDQREDSNPVEDSQDHTSNHSLPNDELERRNASESVHDVSESTKELLESTADPSSRGGDDTAAVDDAVTVDDDDDPVEDTTTDEISSASKSVEAEAMEIEHASDSATSTVPAENAHENPEGTIVLGEGEMKDLVTVQSGQDPSELGGYVLQLDESVYTAIELGELHMIIEDADEIGKKNVAAIVQTAEHLEADNESSAVSRGESSVMEAGEWFWFCNHCSCPFEDKISLVDHHRHLHLPDDCEPDTGSSQQCDVCLKIFSTKGNRDKHMFTVHRNPGTKKKNPKESANQTRINCYFCEKSFRHRSNLLKHSRNEHPDQYELASLENNLDQVAKTTDEEAPPSDKTCEICGKQFPTLLKKEMHVYNHNRSNKIHKCMECDKTFNRIDYLKEHYDKTHGLPKFKCSYCDKRFVRNGYKVIHERVHTNERPYRCNLCSKSFKQWGALSQHQRFHQPKPPATHFCKHCHKGYSYKTDLDRHAVIHSDRRHVCSYCSRPFPTASQLTVHVRTHTGQRPYRCQLCCMCFMTMGGLKRHQQIHDRRESGSFICAICGASYRRQSSMDEHIRVFHHHKEGDEEESTIEESVVEMDSEIVQGEEVIEYVVQEDGIVQLTQGDFQTLTRGCEKWVETTDIEKELVEGIFASQAGERALTVIEVPNSQEN